MKKVLKWVGISLGSLIVLLVIAAFAVPVLFKDEINAGIRKTLDESVNADVSFDINKLDISLFRNFPALTATLKDFGVVNRAPFAGQKLFTTRELEIEVNLFDLIFGNQPKVDGITLIEPEINILVDESGKANYDIAIPSTDTATTTTSSSFSFRIDHWRVVDGYVRYEDKTMPYYLVLKGFNHTGSGDFTQDVFDLVTHSEADSVTTGYAGIEYLTDKHAIADATISISEEFSKFTFKENEARVNDFRLSFDGWLKMNPDNFDMDITFQSPENTFKSLLSIVPGMFTAGFKDLEASGNLMFKGDVKGIYDETRIPAFNINLLVKDGSFKYPAVPAPVNNIQVDVTLINKDGLVQNTAVDLKKFHIDFGKNPVNAQALISSFYPTQIKGAIDASLNLAELTTFFPVEGLTAKGIFGLKVSADGVYDSLKKTIPAITANLKLQDGYVKTASFPIPLEDVQVKSSINNVSGKMAETTVAVESFHMNLDGEAIDAKLLLSNLEDYTWDLAVKGGIDLEKMTKIFPIEGMKVSGKAKANLETKGKYSDLTAGKYDKLPTSGSATLRDFTYETADLPKVTVAEASLVFDPRKISIPAVTGTLGKSDFTMNGQVTNYIGYVMGNGEVLSGNMTLNSRLLDFNELMPESSAPATTDTTSYTVIPVPKNLNFNFQSKIDKVNLMNLTMTNASGLIAVHDGIADLKGITFNLLGGGFKVTGAYDTRDLQHPSYAFGLDIANLSFNRAAEAFSLVQSLAPIAGAVEGTFNTNFSISGELLQNMMPNLATVNGSGLIKIAQAALRDSKIISGITSLTKLDDTKEVTLKDAILSASIKDGKLSLKPFDVKFGNYKTNIEGSTGLDGSLSYNLKMDVPAGKLGAQFNSFIANATSTQSDPNKPIPVKIGVEGNYAQPKFKLLMDEQKAQVKEAVTSTVKEEASKTLQEAVKGKEAEKIVNSVLGKKDTGSAKTPADTAKLKQLQDTKNTIKNLLKKKKN